MSLRLEKQRRNSDVVEVQLIRNYEKTLSTTRVVGFTLIGLFTSLVMGLRLESRDGDEWMKSRFNFIFIMLALLAAVAGFTFLRRSRNNDGILLLKGLGIQILPNNRFIPQSSIKQVLIQEGFSCFQIYFYLTLIVRAPEEQQQIDESVGSKSKTCRHEIVVLFEKSKPRLEILMDVYQEIQKQLFVAR